MKKKEKKNSVVKKLLVTAVLIAAGKKLWELCAGKTKEESLDDAEAEAIAEELVEGMKASQSRQEEAPVGKKEELVAPAKEAKKEEPAGKAAVEKAVEESKAEAAKEDKKEAAKKEEPAILKEVQALDDMPVLAKEEKKDNREPDAVQSLDE